MHNDDADDDDDDNDDGFFKYLVSVPVDSAWRY